MAISLLLLAGCRDPEVKIGAVLPLTGEDAALGQAAKRGLEASLSTLQESPIILEIRDSASDPARARQEMQALVDTDIVAAIGGVTPSEARALAELAETTERVLILPSATEQTLSSGSKWVYQLTASDADAGASFATFAARRFDAESAVLLARDPAFADAMETGFVPTFENLGGELLERFEGDTAALPDLGKKVAELRPEVLVISGDASWQAEAIREARRAGYSGRIFAGRHLAHPETLDSLKRSGDVLFAHTGFDPESSREETRAFIDVYTRQHGEAPDEVTGQVAAEAFDALRVLDLAVRDRAVMASEVRRGLRDEIKGYAGASGSLEFDDSGAITGFPRVYSLNRSGELRDHGEFLDAEEERIAEQRRRLQERLRNLQAGMTSQGDDST